jgi:hypothetical protein
MSYGEPYSRNSNSDSILSNNGLASDSMLSNIGPESSSRKGNHCARKLSDFLDKFKNKRWRAIRKLLKSRKGPALCRGRDYSGVSALTVAMGYHAPTDIIEIILKENPSSVYVKDNFGMTPLHVACLNGSPIDTIKILLDEFPDLATIPDSDLRMPLHHAVECICRLDCNFVCKDSVVEVIDELCKVAPGTVHVRDKHNHSPTDLAALILMGDQVLSKSGDSGMSSMVDRCEYIYDHMKNISIQVYLEKRRKWESDGYDISIRPIEGNTGKEGWRKEERTQYTETTVDTDESMI